MTRTLLGMLTPSSNTVLEPVTAAMVAGLPDVSVHFGRFPVTEISLSERGLGQFELGPPLAAARLLADAHVQVIAWNGTSAGWLGLASDRDLCAAIERETRVAATTSTLALAEIFHRTEVRRYALVSPYIDEVQSRIVANFASEGWDCVAERHLGERRNFAFSEVSETTLQAMVRDVAAAKPEAIVIYCTNLHGAPLVARLEPEIGIPIYDTVATALWSSLRIARVDPRLVRGWGRLFDLT